MRKKALIIGAICLLAGLLAYSSQRAWTQWSEYRQGASAYRALGAYASFPSPRADESDLATPRGEAGMVEALPSQGGSESTARRGAEPGTATPQGEKKEGEPQGGAKTAPRGKTATAGTSEPQGGSETAIANRAAAAPEYADIVWPDVDFAGLSAINPEIVGWLYCEGTMINYPVTRARDNEKYLTRLFDGTYNGAGCLFLDADNLGDFSDLHSVIYGHHRKDGSMFGKLIEYRNQAHYEEHPRLLLVTRDARYVIELFSGYVAASTDDAWQLRFEGDGAFAQWRERVLRQSEFHAPVAPEAEERVLTLSTCSYEFDGARFVLHDVLRGA